MTLFRYWWKLQNVKKSYIMIFVFSKRYFNRDNFYKIKCNCFDISNSYKMSQNRILRYFFPIKDMPIVTQFFKKLNVNVAILTRVKKYHKFNIFFCCIFLNYYIFFCKKIHFRFFLLLCHYTNQFNHKVVLIHHTHMKTKSKHFNIHTLGLTNNHFLVNDSLYTKRIATTSLATNKPKISTLESKFCYQPYKKS